MGVPVEAEHGRVGVIGFYHTTSDRRFTAEDEELAKDLARAVGARLAGADRTLAHLEAREGGRSAACPLSRPTLAEQQVLDRLAAGMAPGEVAQVLSRSTSTVYNQVRSLNAKFGTRSYSETVVKALSFGLAHPDDPA